MDLNMDELLQAGENAVNGLRDEDEPAENVDEPAEDEEDEEPLPAPPQEFSEYKNNKSFGFPIRLICWNVAHRPVAAIISYEGMDQLSGLIRSEPMLREMNGEKSASEENVDTKSAESQSLFTVNEFTVSLHF
jgi:hypothetical protein